jgi:hypothetical protein
VKVKENSFMQAQPKIIRAWAMPTKNTFKMQPVINLLQRHALTPIFDVFPFGDEIDILQRIEKIKDASKLTILLDPPYSPRQAKERYGIEAVQLTALVSATKNALPRILAPGGKIISFGWNTNGMGEKRGFKFVEILLIAHGGSHNDTICCVEERI